MKTLLARGLVALLLVTVSAAAHAALSFNYSGPSVVFPDNNASGAAFGFSLSDSATEISSITVDLNLSGGFNGDLYCYLAHGSGFAVLFNRTGMGETTPGSSAAGYSGTGFAITLTSHAVANVHFYQNDNPAYNGSGQLTGTWQPDGRFIDPDSPPSAFDSPGTAGFDSFTGLDPNGEWTLFFSDQSPGGISTIEGFSVTVSPVPEPVNAALGIFAVSAASLCLLRCYRRRRWSPTGAQ